MTAAFSAGIPALIQFDAAAHVYTVGGIVRPSVTQVLSGVGLIDDSWYSEASRSRGSAVHAACHYLDEGDLDWDSVDPSIRPYLRAWEDFKLAVRLEVLQREQRVFNEVYGFAGTLDFKGLTHGRPQEWILDIKTGAPEDWHRMQTAAYAACQPKNVVQYQRGTVHLSSDGKYSLKIHSIRDTLTDWTDFQAALRVYGLMKRRGIPR